MSCPFDQESLEKLKFFINLCKETPSLLSLPELSFFRNFVESLGGKVPGTPSFTKESTASAKEEKPQTVEASDPETDEEQEEEIPEPVIDKEGCVEPDEIDETQQIMGDINKEVTDEDRDLSDEKRMQALSQFGQGDIDGAIKLITEAIQLNPSSALLYAKRGQMYLKLNKPNACIKDCTKALELNPDSAAAYKFRGRAYRLLGEWEEAAKDFRQACNIDFDEQTNEWLKEVTPNAKKIEEYLLKKERQRLDREEKQRLKRIKKARKAHAKAQQQQQQEPHRGGASGGTPGGGINMGDFANIFKDPELLEALKDPEVAEAIKELNQNPMNFFKLCQTNPKISALMAKIMSKHGGGSTGGFPGFGGGFPGFPGAGGAPPSEGTDAPPSGVPPKAPFVPDDDNLD